MNFFLILFALAFPSPSMWDTVNSRDVCEAASMVLPDMRYTEGGYTAPGDFSSPEVEARLRRCEKVARLAAPHGKMVVFASIAIAYTETNFRPDLVGTAGEVGMMQVIPRWHCEPFDDLNDGSGGCTNPERAGVRFIRRLLSEHSMNKALRLYNGGQKYADRVERYVIDVVFSYRDQQQQQCLAEG